MSLSLSLLHERLITGFCMAKGASVVGDSWPTAPAGAEDFSADAKQQDANLNS